MLEYTLPKPKKKKGGKDKVITEPDDYDVRWMRKVRFPASKEMVEGMSVGDEVTIMVTGKITEVSSREELDRVDDNKFEIDVDKLGMEGGNEFEELSKDDDG